MQITNLEIENFKSLREFKIAIRPITILIGPNNSGKSSVLQALGLLKQSIGYQALATGGDIIRLGNYEDLVFGKDKELNIRIGVSERIILQKPLPLPVERVSQVILYQSYTFAQNGISEVIGEINLFNDSNPNFQYRPLVHAKWSFSARRIGGNERVTIKDERGEIFEVNNFRQIDGLSLSVATKQNTNDMQVLQDVANKLNEMIWHSFSSIYLVPVARGQDKLGLRLVSRNEMEFVNFEGHAAQEQRAISAFAYNGAVEDKVSTWYQRITGSKVNTRMVEQNAATLESVNKDIRTNIMNEGFGPNQLAYLLIPLAAVPKNSTLGIEEPEVHLHPASQIELAEILAQEALSQSKTLIITTHSEYLVSTLLTMVAEGKLDENTLAIYSFEKEGLATKVRALKFDDKGRIEGGLPSFFKTNLSLMERFTKAMGPKK